MPVFTSGGSQVGSAEINDNSIVNADINSAAAIGRAKLASPLLLRVRKSASQALGVGLGAVTWDTEITDTLNAFTSNTFTAPRAMTVQVTAFLPITTGENATRTATVALRLNSSVIRQGYALTGDVSGVEQGLAVIVETLTLATNDTIDVQAGCVSGATQNVEGGTTGAQLTIIEV